MVVSVFGNPDLPVDATAVALMPELSKRFPDITFEHRDPAEELAPTQDDFWLIDVVRGIDKVTLITDADIIQATRRVSMHDYDLGMHLTLLKKIRPALQVRIIGIPYGMKPADAVEDVARLLRVNL